MSRSSPGSPTSAKRGTWWVELAKRALPRPPRPPRATTTARLRMGEVGDELVALEHLRADRDVDLDALAARAVLAGAAAVAALGRGDPLARARACERSRRSGSATSDDVAAVAAVAAVGAALRARTSRAGTRGRRRRRGRP